MTDSSPSDDELTFKPIESPSREQFERKFDPIVLTKPLPSPLAEPIRFSLADMMIVTAGIAVGSAGGNWMPADVFAGMMGVGAIAGAILYQRYPPESHMARVVWLALGLAYVLAIVVAIFKQTMA